MIRLIYSSLEEKRNFVNDLIKNGVDYMNKFSYIGVITDDDNDYSIDSLLDMSMDELINSISDASQFYIISILEENYNTIPIPTLPQKLRTQHTSKGNNHCDDDWEL